MLTNILKELRMRRYMLNQKEFSRILGVSEAQYSRYESKTAQPSLEIAIKISIALNMTVNDIWKFE